MINLIADIKHKAHDRNRLQSAVMYATCRTERIYVNKYVNMDIKLYCTITLESRKNIGVIEQFNKKKLIQENSFY